MGQDTEKKTIRIIVQSIFIYTLPELTANAPENGQSCPFGMAYFQVRLLLVLGRAAPRVGFLFFSRLVGIALALVMEAGPRWKKSGFQLRIRTMITTNY